MNTMDKNLAKENRELFRRLRRNIRSETVLLAMKQVPRERFVPVDKRHMAYLDVPLGIGQGQTISQPYIVALMTQALELEGGERVLEVGTGSGYQAGVLSLLVPRGRLISVERIPELADRAKALLAELRYNNVTVELAQTTLGAPHHTPFDAIVVTAACPKLPESLVAQLAVRGRLVFPIGTRDSQELIQARRTEEGLSIRWMGPCRFVPLIGPEAFPDT